MRKISLRMMANEIIEMDQETACELEDLLNWLIEKHPTVLVEYSSTIDREEE